MCIQESRKLTERKDQRDLYKTTTESGLHAFGAPATTAGAITTQSRFATCSNSTSSFRRGRTCIKHLDETGAGTGESHSYMAYMNILITLPKLLAKILPFLVLLSPLPIIMVRDSVAKASDTLTEGTWLRNMVGPLEATARDERDAPKGRVGAKALQIATQARRQTRTRKRMTACD